MKLVIFLPLGGSIKSLKNRGELSRFKDNYLKKYLEKFDSVSVVSYEDNEPQIPNVTILSNKHKIHRYIYQFAIPFIFRNELKQSIFRVMQLNGLIPALIAKLIAQGKVTVTFGYDYQRFALLDKKYLQAIGLKLMGALLLPLADNIIIPNKKIYNSFAKRVILKRKIHYLPNGVNIKLFSPIPALLLQKSSKNISILSIGRLETQKNYQALIRSLNELVELKNRVSIVLIGQGRQHAYLTALAKNSRIDLKIIDFVDNKKLPEYYRRCDLYVSTSLAEGSPKTLIEAMSCSCAVLASDVEGNQEIIDSGKDGVLFSLSVENDLVDKLKMLLSDQKLRSKLGSNAREKITRHFNLSTNLDREVAILKS